MAKFTGTARLKNWTPKLAARAAKRRIADIQLLLQEIADLYGEVFEPVVNECDSIRDHCIPALDQAIDEALAEGRTR